MRKRMYPEQIKKGEEVLITGPFLFIFMKGENSWNCLM